MARRSKEEQYRDAAKSACKAKRAMGIPCESSKRLKEITSSSTTKDKRK